ncbi:GAF domain-containing protein [Methylobacterium sp. J-067]|uniref:GAF domain-containing protein n=1 Tax=Methylobacterium sp. J-067 TaxID=2836648 RepID=UPI001FBB60AF|nr:GAF domain-containing protein [Methylobacterium sp. J-067]MCJ2026961.1 GAF domain-containing protein [Methylobacterium sp. J-067]
MIPARPENPAAYAGDAGRLAALTSYGLPGTPGDETFDGLIRLATEACAAPVGMITLVAAERQWFKARIGFEEAETGLDRSICVHALPETDALVISDLTRDPRTRDNLAVTGPSAFRFYAGAPLRSACGHGLGAVCVIDRTPREGGLTRSQADFLRGLADQVMALFEARRALLAREEEAAGLRASAAFLHSVLAASPDCIKVLDLEGRLDFMNGPGLVAMEVDDFATIHGAYWPRFWAGPSEDEARAAVARAAAGGEGRFEGWAHTLRGVVRYWDVSVTPIRGGDGRPERLLAVSRDRTTERQASVRLAALTRLGDDIRSLAETDSVSALAAATAGETLGLSRAAYGAVDRAESGIDFQRGWTRQGQRSVVGRHRYADYGRYIDDLRRGETVVIADVRTDPRTAASLDALRRFDIGALVNVPAMAGEHLVGVLCLHESGPRAWTGEEVAFAKAVADRTRLALMRIAAEEQQQLRTHEVGHRLKNLLAMVQAIATQTLRSADDLTGASEVLAGRLAGLGQSYDLLLDGELATSPIRDVVTRALHLHADASGRFDVSGPEILVGGQVALSLSLMLHELATNAAKYGALSNVTGRVAVEWQIREAGGGTRLRLAWTERGGPPVAPPNRKGFGTRLIERGLAGQVGGEVALAYKPEGFAFTIEAPLAAFRSGNAVQDGTPARAVTTPF